MLPALPHWTDATTACHSRGLDLVHHPTTVGHLGALTGDTHARAAHAVAWVMETLLCLEVLVARSAWHHSVTKVHLSRSNTWPRS